MTFREYAIDTLYRMGWTFTQALLSCMTFGQAITDMDWKNSLLIALGATVFVLLKQFGKWCLEHIKDGDDLPMQYTFNCDDYKEMMGDYDEKADDTTAQ